MKSIDRKLNETDSPKTPGGISKSHLTPIRRLGLSRRWKKSGTSPFVSPLAGNIVKNNENEDGEIRTRKRKLCVDEDSLNLPSSPISDNSNKVENNEINSTPPPQFNADTENTPVRRVAVTRKKCKSSVTSENSKVCTSTFNQIDSIILNEQKSDDIPKNKQANNTSPKQKSSNKVSNTKKSPEKVITEERNANNETTEDTIKIEDEGSNLQKNKVCISEPKVQNLTKECIEVIQKKIFKLAKAETQFVNINKEDNKKINSTSQVLFDSDDEPLSTLNKQESKQKSENLHIKNLDDDDFIDTKINSGNKKEISNKAVSIVNKKANSSKTTDEKTTHVKKQIFNGKQDKVQVKKSSQKPKYFDDDDEDFEVSKKTILIRKSYDKVIKPSKSKSTGSITQKDVDELRARIEMKKKLLIAKSMTEDTEELRGLIKKWQKGCQDALMELLDLMRNKMPDQSNMNYSYILDMLKIPPSLVGYDEENESFHTPDDNSILTAAFNDV